MEIEQLPPLDFCVLSHYHGDHFDRIAEEQLRKDLPVVTTKHAASELKDKGFTAPVGIDTWDAVAVSKGGAGVRVTSMPGRHGPPIVEKFLPPVMGSMLEFEPAPGRTALRLYITGDTLVFDDLNEIPRRYPDIDLALFHLGGTQIMGILLTMDAEQGVEAIRIINPREVIPIHYNDYEVFKSPLEDFRKAVEAGFADRVKYLAHGDTYDFEVPASRWGTARRSGAETARAAGREGEFAAALLLCDFPCAVACHCHRLSYTPVLDSLKRSEPHGTLQLSSTRTLNEKVSLAIIESRWNNFLTARGQARSTRSGASGRTSRRSDFQVPGSFEIPLAALRRRDGKFDGVICLGTIIRGQTPHFDYIAGAVTKGIAQAGMRGRAPLRRRHRQHARTGDRPRGGQGGQQGVRGREVGVELVNLYKQCE